MTFLTFPYRVLKWMMLTRPIRFTRLGTFYILFSLGVGAAAINTGNNLLYLILGILLGFIVISGFLSDSGLWGITTDWSPLGSLYAGEPAAMECRISKGWFPGVAVTVESRWKAFPSQFSFAPWIPGNGAVTLKTSITPKRRGHLVLESCHYATHFPFGLFQKSHTEKMDRTWVVYPTLFVLPRAALKQQGEEASQDASQRLGVGAVPLVLRDYRTGDAIRQVHWKASAKRQRLIVKEMEEETSEGELFRLNAWPRHLSAEDTEKFISFIASAIFCLYKEGRSVGLITPDTLFKPDNTRIHLHRLLEYLALVDPWAPPMNAIKPSMLQTMPRMTDLYTLWESYVAQR